MKEWLKKRIHNFKRLQFRLGKIVFGIMLVIGIAWPAVKIDQGIEQWTRVTQEQIADGWRAAGIEITDHRIARKENFWRVARKYRIDIDTIIGANPELKSLHASNNQVIRVPNYKGVLHAVQDQETVENVSELYGISPDIINAVNNVGKTKILGPGLEIFIPDARPVRLTPNMSAQYGLRGIFGSPVRGRITSGMGERKHPIGGFRGKHTGIDLAASKGTRIVAAASGTVVNVGEGEYIGKFVILSHQDSYTTLYGHCSVILAKTGQSVKKGQIIARVGTTGRVTGPHLHFEIRENGVPQDPLKYLW